LTKHAKHNASYQSWTRPPHVEFLICSFARGRTEVQRIGKRSLCERHFAALEVQDARRMQIRRLLGATKSCASMSDSPPKAQPIFTMLPWQRSPLLEQSQTPQSIEKYQNYRFWSTITAKFKGNLQIL